MTDRRLLTPFVKMLLDAADYLEKYGYHKGAYFDGYVDYDSETLPAACLVGSMMAARRVHDTDTLVNRGERYMNEYLGVPDCTVWSDDLDRTKEEVVFALRSAAAEYKEYSDDEA